MPVVKFTNKVSVKPPHIHIKRQTEEFILYFVLSGEMYLKEGSREYALKPGDMLILDPHLVHCGTKASSCTYFYIHFYHDRMAECSGPEELVKNELVSSRFAALQTDECSIRKNPASSILLPKHMHIGQPGADGTAGTDQGFPLQSSGAFSAEYRVPVSAVSHSSVTGTDRFLSV